MDIYLGKPNPKQQLFLDSTVAHTAYGGAMGGGKSWALRTLFTILALQYKKLKLLLLRRTYTDLRHNHILPLLDTLRGVATYTDIHKTFTFANGSMIILGYCDTESDVLRYQGQEYDVIGMEEATQFTEYQRNYLMMRNRNTRKDFTPRMYYTCNPGGVGHAWIKRLFIDREYNERECPNDYNFIQASVYDNKAIMDNDPKYVKSLESLPDEQRRAYLYGDWDVYAGQYFTEFSRTKHVIDPINIPDTSRRFASIDYGYNDYTAVYWYAVHDSHIYVYREYHVNKTLASDIASYIASMEPISYLVASPDMWQTRGQGVQGENIASEFSKRHIPIVRADNARVVGWNRVREYLTNAQDNIPYLQIFNTCTKLIKHFPMIVHDTHKPEDCATEPHYITDTLDSLRYGLMSRPSPNTPKQEDNPHIFGSDQYKMTHHINSIIKKNRKEAW